MGSVIYISLAGFEPDLDSNGYYLDEQRPVFELVCLQQKSTCNSLSNGQDWILLGWQYLHQMATVSLTWVMKLALGEIKISGSWVMRLGHQLAGVL